MPDEIWDRVRAVMGPKAEPSRRVYDAGQTHQDSWGWKVSAYLWTKSIASGCLMLAPFLGGPGPEGAVGTIPLTAVLLSLLFLAATSILLVADLRRPGRFLWVLTRPQWRSWLTRGSYILLLFGIAASGMAAAGLAGAHGAWRALAPPAVILAAAGAAYTAFLFWQAKGRDLWQSPILPFHLVVQAAVGGLSATILAALALGSGPVAAGGLTLPAWLAAALALSGAMVLAELFTIHPTEDAAAAARWMRTGRRRDALVVGVLLVGHAAPVALALRGGPAASAAAAAFALAGLAVWEHLYVRAGQSVPLS